MKHSAQMDWNRCVVQSVYSDYHCFVKGRYTHTHTKKTDVTSTTATAEKKQQKHTHTHTFIYNKYAFTNSIEKRRDTKRIYIFEAKRTRNNNKKTVSCNWTHECTDIKRFNSLSQRIYFLNPFGVSVKDKSERKLIFEMANACII